jgi:glycine/D-amino acid oxidase-like deaminating enzyme
MSRGVAVIGGGVFGCVAALRLAEQGHAVSMFERAPALMGGASYNNQNRLHLGFHYPRDDETARQCVRGFERFRRAFAPAILDGFPNAYFIASEGSMTTPQAFLAFCARNGLAYGTIDLERFEPHVQGVALGVLTGEVVYDSALLRGLVAERLGKASVRVALGLGVERIARRAGGGYGLTTADGERHEFDGVINACYADAARLTGQLGVATPVRQYEYTAVAVVELDRPQPVGVTILDGPFMTVLPFGKTGLHLLYHVRDVVIAREDTALLNPAWRDPATGPFREAMREAWFAGLIDDCAEFVPALRQARLKGFLQGPRMVLARREDTDARPSVVDEPEPGYITVFSGKIDHCLWVADEIVERLEAR